MVKQQEVDAMDKQTGLENLMNDEIASVILRWH